MSEPDLIVTDYGYDFHDTSTIVTVPENYATLYVCVDFWHLLIGIIRTPGRFSYDAAGNRHSVTGCRGH